MAAALVLATAAPIVLAGSAQAATGTVTGVVFNDYDADGARDGGEPGIQGAEVYAYDADGVRFGPATTDNSGAYTLALSPDAAAGPIRVELTSYPTGFQPSLSGTNSATTIRFETFSDGGTVPNVDYALQEPGAYCQNNPDIATTVFCVGDGNSTATTFDALWRSSYDQSSRTGVAPPSEVGSISGIAWDPVTRSVFAAAYVKRHAGIPDGRGADSIYVMDPDTDATSVWIDLGDLGIDAGQSTIPSNSARGITSSSLLSADPVFNEVGKVGIGDIETNGADTLFVTNLYERTVLAIDIPADGSAPTSYSTIGEPADWPACSNGTARPFALAYQDGYVHVGIVCDAASGTVADLDAYVLRSTGDGSWSQVGPTINLDFPQKGQVFVDGGRLPNGTQPTDPINLWHVWDDTIDASWDSGANSTSAPNASFIIRPTPMLSDIAFDDDGSMVLAFRDRTGDMIGADNYAPVSADGTLPGVPAPDAGGTGNDLVFAMSGGDIMRVCLVGGTYVLEGPAACPPNDLNGQGPGGGEYYGGDTNSNGHKDLSNGHIVIVPRSGDTLLSATNAVNGTANSGGIRGLDNATGAYDASITANYYENGRPVNDVAVFGKANGLGDLEALCDAAPLEVGNRVWRDLDANGIQDPGEPGIDGVTVQLFAASDTSFSSPLGTAVTANGGQYFFRTGFVDGNTNDNIGGGLTYRDDFVVRFGSATDYASGPLDGLFLSPADQSPGTPYSGDQDWIDSDPATGSGDIGADWFPTVALAAEDMLPGLNDHTFDAGFVPPLPYDLALRKTVVSMNGSPASGSVTFLIEVFNQGANAVEDVTVVDYIDAGSFEPLTSAPASGTTGGDANLPFTWDVSDSSAPEVTIDGVIGAGDSVTFEVTLTIASAPSMAGLVNHAEIAAFDNDGDPSNGNSTTGAVYDVDSIPDTTNSDALVDNEIGQQRWTNTPTSSSENTGVADEDDHDVATVPLFDLALIKERAAGQDQVIVTPATTATFDITVKNQGATDVYDVVVLDSPTAPLTLNPSTDASQSVTTADGASVTVTFVAATGRFTVPALAAGDAVTFQVVTDLAATTERQVNTAEIVSFDDDADTGNVKPSWVQDFDSTPDTDPGNDALEPGVDPDFAEDSHNDIDNAPVNGANPNDEDDHDSEAVQLGLLRLGSTVYKDANGNDVGDPGEEVAGVLVQLFDGSGTLVAETVTNSGGDYSFDQLYPGTYQVGIPEAQSHGTLTGIDSTALEQYEPVPGSVASPETTNFDNDGDAQTGFLSRSDDIVLTFGAEPTNDDADDADADALTSPRTYADENSNLNIDFVFEQITYELGNLVWSDTGAGANYSNGLADSDESGIDGVAVELYRDNGAGGGIAGDGVLHPDELIATTTTSGGGFYTFTDLVAADDYIVHIPVSAVPAGYGASGTPVTVGAADGVDNDNNAVVDGVTGWSSGAIELGAAATTEPTGEEDGTTETAAQPAASVADNRADQTIDFGFIPSVRIGNQVWRDESDTNPQTQSATDNNGRFDAGELGLGGVSVELWLDVNGNGAFERGGADGATALATTTTTSEGNYWFEGVRPDRQYFVVIPDIGSVAPYTAQSSDGQSAAVAAFDNDDDGAPVGFDLAVSRPFIPSEGGASLNEADAVEPGDGTSTADANAETEANAAGGTYDDNDSELRIDFGFINVPVYRVGNLVWLDNGGDSGAFNASNEANGIANAGEPGIPGVEVQLWDGPGITQLATTFTNADGDYTFENLAAGNYTVRIPSTGVNAATLAGLTSTIDAVSSTDFNTDHDDDGRAISGAWSSTLITLSAANAFTGAEPVGESFRQGQGAGYDTGLSLTLNPNDPPLYADNRSNFTVDFGFARQYRLGNLVWNDYDNDGVAEAGEPGLAGVTVRLYNASTGTELDSTVTDADGFYEFTGLLADDYVVRVDTSTLPAGMVASGTPAGSADDDVDNDTNAGDPAGTLTAPGATVTLGEFDEPNNETVRDDDATDDDADSFADTASNYSVDFGFWSQLRIGNVVWHDESDTDPATYAATDNNGVFDSGESALQGVTVSLWRDGGDGAFDAGTGGGDDTFIGTDVTAADGTWDFTGLAAGTYFAAIENLPAAQVTWVSSSGQQTDADDNDDNGAPATDGAGTDYVSVSGPIVLAAGAAPENESDVAPGGTGAAETAANATVMVVDANSDLTVDFGFVTPPVYRIGNLVWRDLNADGVADAGEPGIGGVLVQLYDGTGALINETLTDAQGFYEFTETAGGQPLAAGDYEVRIPTDQVSDLGTIVPGNALAGMATSPGSGTPEDDDNDDDGALSGDAWTSGTVTLGDPSGTGTFETEPITEVRRTDSADDDLGWSGGTDARSQFQVDFGFVPGLRLGDVVWFDDGRTGAGTFDVAFDNDGIRQATELPAVGVDVALYEDDGDGVFEPGGDDGAAVATTTTDSDGQYFFTGLAEGTYFVAIAAAEQASGQPLEGWVASTPVSADGAGTNDTNHGTAATGFASVTGPIALVRGAMAYGESADEATADAKTSTVVGDADSNLTADFGFVEEPLYRLGNLVWLDANDDGIADSGEAPLDGITVQLIEDDGDGIFEPGTDAVLDTVVTGAGALAAGRYEFTDLSAGSYFVYVPFDATNFAGLDSSQVREANANGNVDNDNNAIPVDGNDITQGWVSGLVELGAIGAAGDNDEPTGETDGLNSASAEDGAVFDERSNMTVDFGFAQRVRIGNQVWRDESDDDASTVVSTDNDGVFNAAEVGIAGVTVELWRDVDGDGFEAGDDDVQVATTTTNAEGNYWFDGLIPGEYIVAIPTVGAPGEVRSSGGQSAAAQAGDNDDDGAPLAGYVAVSRVVAVEPLDERTGEADAIEPGDGASTADADAEAEANAAGRAYPDASSGLDVDFGFVDVPLYRVGNRVWLDANNDGIAQVAENGINGVLVQLLNASGDVIAETVTANDGAGNPGYYAFANLAAGDYQVRIPGAQTPTLGALPVSPTALTNLASSTTDVADPDAPASTDNDDNGIGSGSDWVSGQFTLGTSDDTTTDTERTDETLRADSATDDDSGWSDGTDGRSDFTIDFGFYELLRIGDLVWLDNGGAGASYDPADENNGVWDAAEPVVDGVSVQLFRDGGDGVWGGDDTPAGTTTTAGGGLYFFDGLTEGTYFVAIPDSMLATGQPLAGTTSSTGQAANDATNSLDQGAPQAGFAAVSNPVVLVAGAMSNGDSADEARADALTGTMVSDASSNLAIDFGFVPQPTYALGNLVWEDFDNDGVVDAGEPGIAGVDVELYLDVNTNGVVDGGDTQVGTDTTDGSGRYLFENLLAGDYLVHVPDQAALTDWFVGGTPTATADQGNSLTADNDNDANPDAVNGGYTSGAVTLGGPAGPADNDEPVGESDANTSADAEAPVTTRDDRSNQTVDFGFWRGLRLGNQVWRDESDSDASTVDPTDNDGVFNGTEVGLLGVSVELWQDVDGDGFEAGDDDVLVDTTTTNAEGNYWFTGLDEGTDYYVAIPTVGSPLTTARSSAGQSGAFDDADNDDDGAPLAGYLSVSNPITLTVGALTTGEDDAIEPGDGTSTDDANAEVEANAATASYPDANSALDVDFGFVEVPLYRVGNLVWLDADNDGLAEAGEDPIEGVLVQLLNGSGTVIAETVTDSTGEYAFANLVEGDYTVRIPSAQVETLGGGLTIVADALENLAISTVTAGDPDTDADDNDNNGAAITGGWESAPVTLGDAADETDNETEPTTEADRNGGDDDTGWADGTDARSNFTVDFGFYQLLRIGDLVWLDNGGSGTDYDPGYEDNGAYESTVESPLAGVDVSLFRDGGDGVFGGDDTPVATTQTNGAGVYLFDGLTPGDYWVAIPDTEHASGQPLEGLRSSTGQFADYSANDRDQGAPASGWAAVSRAVPAAAGAMPTIDSAFEARADGISGFTVADASSNLAVDFGFSPEPTYALGNLVWEDVDNDGVADLGEPGIGGVTVQIFRDVNTDGAVDAGDTLVDTTTTTATGPDTGRYRFEDLVPGNYLVHVPDQAALTDWSVGGTPSPTADQGNSLAADNDNDANPDSTNGGYTSGPVTLGGAAGPADHDEPVAERDGIDNVDAELLVTTRDDRSNQTVDFGFWRGLRIGNQVWLDEGAGANQDNGVFDSDESGLLGITVELWADDGDDVFEPGADDTLVDSTTTGAEGRYYFEHVAEGAYFVAIPAGPAGTLSSTGAPGASLAVDGQDAGEPVGSYVAVSPAYDLEIGDAESGETDGPASTDGEAAANAAVGAYADDSSYLTIDFGLVQVPTFRIGNLVWFDGDNDGQAETGEPGIGGVLVQLTDAGGTVLAETVTDGAGFYEFTGLTEGDYRVQIPTDQTPVVDVSLASSIVAGALDGYFASTSPETDADNHVDNDANGVPFPDGVRSGIVALRGAEPVTETVRADDATDDDGGQASPRIDDDRSDYSVDFGFGSISLGNQVFTDVDGDGVFEPGDGDAGIPGVTVQLLDDTSAVIDSMVTDGDGLYLFTGLYPGESYSVRIPASQFAAGGALEGLYSSPGDAGTVASDDADGRDRGVDPAAAYGDVVQSGVWTATASGAPVTDGTGDNPDNDAVRPDAAENLVVDFGFYWMELGGTVFVDPDNNGQDGDDGDFADVTLLLFDGAGNPVPGPDGAQRSTVTDANGDYRFTGLPQGTYIVEIPASEFSEELDGWASSDGNAPTPDANDDAVGEDEGDPVSGTIFDGNAVRASTVTLTVDGEPTSDPTPSAGVAHSQSNLTVDFGFWQAQSGLELGNQLWFDDNRNGVFDQGELPLPALIELELLDADTLTVLQTTYTNPGGQYLFTGLDAGDYIVRVTAVNFQPGQPLAGYMVTDGAGISPDPDDEVDSDSNGVPLPGQSVDGVGFQLQLSGVQSAPVTLRAAAPTGEVDPASGALDDRQSDLTVDFGFVRAPELAFTGADVGGALRLAAALMLAGVAFIVGGRRRRIVADQD